VTAAGYHPINPAGPTGIIIMMSFPAAEYDEIPIR